MPMIMHRPFKTPLLRQASLAKRRRLLRLGGIIFVVVAIAGATAYAANAHLFRKAHPAAVVQETKPAAKVRQTAKAPVSVPPPVQKQPAPVTMCDGNSFAQLIVVSISQRHIWACNATTVLYDSPVVTGMENLAADLTPTGTYHIYAKETNLYLKGSDSTGSWNDYVYYWMPFLDNQYGVYGFHDATWRPDSAFGNISPYSSDASHGCVELPLATAKWLYNWAQVGTTLTIES